MHQSGVNAVAAVAAAAVAANTKTNMEEEIELSVGMIIEEDAVVAATN